MRVIISAGGTGGHIYPALAIVNKIKEKDANSEFLYIGTTDRMEKDIVPKQNIPYFGIDIEGIKRKKIFSNVNVLKKYVIAKSSLKKVISEFNPDIVIGTGGYVTAPVIKCAKKLGYKTLVHEQNAVFGLTNKLLLKSTDVMCTSIKSDISNSKIVFTGNPRSEEVSLVKSVSKSSLGFDSTLKLVVVVMGSLGSMSINTKLKEMIPFFSNKHYQVLVVTGKNYFDDFNDISIPDNVKVVSYIDNFIGVMKSCDLLISRAGATTISEITSIGVGSILVPSPYVTNNHQLKNAMALEEVGACKIIEESDFSKDSVITCIDYIFDNKEEFDKMKEASLSLGVNDSATRIYEEIRKLLGD